MIDSFKRDSLQLAELKYYDHEHNGIEMTKPLSHVVLAKIGDKYFNALDLEEELPTFERMLCTENSYGDEYFGTKVKLLSGECSTGPCWLISSDYDLNKRFNNEVVTKKELEDFVLNSPLYFKDRIAIARERLSRLDNFYKMSAIIFTERYKLEQINAFYEGRMSKKEFMKTDKN